MYLKASSFMTVLGGRVGGEGEELVFLVTRERTAVLSCHRRFRGIERHEPFFRGVGEGSGSGRTGKGARGGLAPAGARVRAARRIVPSASAA